MSLKGESIFAVVDPRAQGAERVLRRLGAAIKAYGLYPPHHPIALQAQETLLGVLRPFLKVFGAFVARISRGGLEVDGHAYDGEVEASLALHLYTRKLSFLTISPPVTDQEVAAFLEIAGQDRVSLEAAGGVEHLLWQSSVGNIVVIEMALDEEPEVQGLGLNAFLALIGRGRLAPREREAVVEILFEPSDTARLLYNLYQMAAEVLEGAGHDERVGYAYQAVRSLDRIILDAPLEHQSSLYAGLTEALLLTEEPLGTALAATLVSRAGEDASAKLLLQQFSLDRLGEFMLRAFRPDRAAEQAVAAVEALALSERREAALIALLETRLRPEAPPGWLRAMLRPSLPPGERRIPEVPPEFAFDDSLILISHEALAERVAEGRAITEAGATREVIITLLDILRDETDGHELAEVADALAGSLPWIMEQQEFGLLTTVLARLTQLAASPEEPRGKLAAAIVRRVTEHPLLDQLLAALWVGRETPAEEEVRRALMVLGGAVVTPLVGVLGGEPRAEMRAVLCEVLVGVARDHIADLAGFVSDDRWYLVRNIANILGRLQAPEVLRHLERITTHAEYRVRREVVGALARIGTEAAQTLLVRMLDDPDPRIQLRALEALNAWGARHALPRLLALLDTPDPLHHLFPNKVAALEAVERLRAVEALPVVRRLARRLLAIGQHQRELRDLARRVVHAIEAGGEGRPDLPPTDVRSPRG